MDSSKQKTPAVPFELEASSGKKAVTDLNPLASPAPTCQSATKSTHFYHNNIIVKKMVP